MPKYKRVLRAVSETPWALREDKLADIKAFLTRVSFDGPITPEALNAEYGSAPERPRMKVGSVEIIPVFGVISEKVNLMSEFSGGTSTEKLAAQIQKAVDDKTVGSILLDVDSPGGSVFGVPELADFIMKAREQKRIVAIAHSEAASAAYWVASAASELVVTPSGMVGSIGVFMAHDDVSKAQEMAGVKTTIIRAGKYKIEANPFEPLTEEARADLQAKTDDYYEMFVRGVAAGRGVDPRTVRSEFGQGRMVMAAAAKEQKMVDRVATFDATLGRMLVRSARQSGDHSAFETVRDFEAFLRDEGGLSNTAAKKLAAVGFEDREQPPRDGDVAPVTLTGVEDQEGLSALRAFSGQVNTR